MFDWIPISSYTILFYNAMLAAVLFTFLHTVVLTFEEDRTKRFMNVFGLFLLSAVILYMGFRPISGKYFVDMGTYARIFTLLQEGEVIATQKDVFFNYFIKLCTMIMNIESFFFLCTLLYMLPMYLTAKKLFKEYWFYGFLFLITSMSFWAYGTNGIRNGMATSIFLLAISRDSMKIKVALLLVAYLFHSSLALPIIAFVLAAYLTDTKYYLFFWFLAIPLSLAFGGLFESVFTTFGFGDDDRLATYLTGEIDETVNANVKMGFRWDFLIYSGMAVYAGWFYIYKKQYSDLWYTRLFNTFLLANAFWIMVIRAPFSNRFAYLSWFMMGIIVIYPFLKVKLYHEQHLKIGQMALAYFGFTYLLYLLLG